MNSPLRLSIFAAGLYVVASASIAAPAVVATYKFNNTLAADQAGVAALQSVDPQIGRAHV